MRRRILVKRHLPCGQCLNSLQATMDIQEIGGLSKAYSANLFPVRMLTLKNGGWENLEKTSIDNILFPK